MVWATMSMYTTYLWESLHDYTSCMLVNQEGGCKVSLGKGREEGSQIPPAGEELIEEQCLLILACRKCTKGRIKV